MTSTTLRELIGDERHALDALLEETEGEVTPEIAALWAELDDKIASKVESWGLWIARQASMLNAIDAEIARLEGRKSAVKRAIASSKAELQRQMELAGLDKVKGVLVTVALQKNPPSVKGELAQPDLWKLYEAWRVGEGPEFVTRVPEVYKLDRDAVKVAHKAGQPIPAGLTVEQGTSLRVR